MGGERCVSGVPSFVDIHDAVYAFDLVSFKLIDVIPMLAKHLQPEPQDRKNRYADQRQSGRRGTATRPKLRKRWLDALLVEAATLR